MKSARFLLVFPFVVACGEPLIPMDEPGEHFRLVDVDGAAVPAPLNGISTGPLTLEEGELLLAPMNRATIAAAIRFQGTKDTTITKTTHHAYLIRGDSVVMCASTIPPDPESIAVAAQNRSCVAGSYSRDDIQIPYVDGAWLQMNHTYHFVHR